MMLRLNAKVVALCGRRRVGKDTIAQHLIQRGSDMRGGGAVTRWAHVKIAAHLKTCVAAIFDLTEAEVEGDDKDTPIRHEPYRSAHVTPRRLMQWFGTDVMQHAFARDVCPNVGRFFWVRHTVLQIKEIMERDGGSNVVISDVRFPHELDILEQEFGSNLIKIYLERPNAGGQGEEIGDEHESESIVVTLADRADILLQNEGNVKDLLARVDGLIID